MFEAALIDDPWVYGLSIDFNLAGALNPNPAPFHPTKEGQEAIYEQVKVKLLQMIN